MKQKWILDNTKFYLHPIELWKKDCYKNWPVQKNNKANLIFSADWNRNVKG